MRESCRELFSTNNSALTFRITPFEPGAAGMLLFLSQWRAKWTSKETVTAIDYWQLRRSRRLGCDTNTPLWDAAVKIYNCHDSIVPKYHTVNLWLNEVGAMKRSIDTKRGTEMKKNERSVGPIRKNRSEWRTVGRIGWKKGGGEVLLRWRPCERMEEDKNVEKQWWKGARGLTCWCSSLQPLLSHIYCFDRRFYSWKKTIKSHDGHSDSGNSSISMRAMHIHPYFMRVYSYMLIDDDAEERRYYALLSSIKNAPLIPCFVECRRQR